MHKKLIEIGGVHQKLYINSELDRTCVFILLVPRLVHQCVMQNVWKLFAFFIYVNAAPNLSISDFSLLFIWLNYCDLSRTFIEIGVYLYNLIVSLDQHHEHWHCKQVQLKKHQQRPNTDSTSAVKKKYI